MVVSKVHVAFVLIILLLDINTTDPRHYRLNEDEWRKLVGSAMFTGAKLSDSAGTLLVHPLIMEILANNTCDRNVERNIRQDPEYIYFPNLTAAYGMNNKGDILGVFFSGYGSHAEEKVIDNINRHELNKIGISFSPCSRCIRMFETLPTKPKLQFSWVYKHPQTFEGQSGIGKLFRRGYDLESWNTRFVLQYLLQQAPRNDLRSALLHTYLNIKDSLLNRDMKTQKLVMNEFNKYLLEENESDEAEPYWSGWPNSRCDDDDDEPDAGGAAIGGDSGNGGGSLGGSSTNNRKAASSYKQRTTTTQHDNSGWSFDTLAMTVLAIWLILLTWSVNKKLYRLCKGEGIKAPPIEKSVLKVEKEKPEKRKCFQVTTKQRSQIQDDKKVSRKRRRRPRRTLELKPQSDDKKLMMTEKGKGKHAIDTVC